MFVWLFCLLYFGVSVMIYSCWWCKLLVWLVVCLVELLGCGVWMVELL